MDHGVLPDRNVRAEHRVRADHGPGGNHAAGTDHHVRTYAGPLIHHGIHRYHGRWMDSLRGTIGGRGEKLQHVEERGVWIMHPHQRHLRPIELELIGDQQRRRMRGFGEFFVLRIGDERDVSRPRLLYFLDGKDLPFPVTDENSTDSLSDFCQAHR